MDTGPTVEPDYASAISAGPGGSFVDVWAVPGASRTEIAGMHGGALRIRVSAPPEGGKANRALADTLAGISRAQVVLVKGQSSRRKRFLVKDVEPADLVRFVSGQTP
jgi:hypothetical protein